MPDAHPVGGRGRDNAVGLSVGAVLRELAGDAGQDDAEGVRGRRALSAGR